MLMKTKCKKCEIEVIFSIEEITEYGKEELEMISKNNKEIKEYAKKKGGFIGDTALNSIIKGIGYIECPMCGGKIER